MPAQPHHKMCASELVQGCLPNCPVTHTDDVAAAPRQLKLLINSHKGDFAAVYHSSWLLHFALVPSRSFITHITKKTPNFLNENKPVTSKMASKSTVIVKNISPESTDDSIRDFFSFW